MTIQRMDHVGVVVDDLEAAISLFVELGMELDGGPTPVDGDWVDRVVGLNDVRVEIALVRAPGGHGRLESELADEAVHNDTGEPCRRAEPAIGDFDGHNVSRTDVPLGALTQRRPPTARRRG